jgi:hypothetical protein
MQEILIINWIWTYFTYYLNKTSKYVFGLYGYVKVQKDILFVLMKKFITFSFNIELNSNLIRKFLRTSKLYLKIIDLSSIVKFLIILIL